MAWRVWEVHLLCWRTFSFSSSSLLFDAAAGVIFLRVFFGEAIVFPPMFVASTMASCFVSNAHSREQCFSFGGKRYFWKCLQDDVVRWGQEARRSTLLYWFCCCWLQYGCPQYNYLVQFCVSSHPHTTHSLSRELSRRHTISLISPHLSCSLPPLSINHHPILISDTQTNHGK